MCFSATASFATAGLTAIIGLVSLSRAKEKRAIPLAATPMLFALQQAIEGLLWLNLPSAPAGPVATGSTYLFLFFALAFWPVYAPVAVLLVEPCARRRRLMYFCLAIGLGVGGYMLWWILNQPHGAVIQGGHVVYITGLGLTFAIAPAYLSATALPLLLSSRRTVVGLGAIILVGSVVAYVFYWGAFVSVWCFFAAAASLVILGHFEQTHRQRLRAATT